MMQVHSVSYEAAGRFILSDVSFEVNPGELLVVLGANGAGKSTLLKCISGELHPANGTVHMNGKSVAQYSSIELARVRAVLTQKFSLNLPFKTEEVVEMGRYAFADRDTKKQCEEIIHTVMQEADVAHLKGRLYTSLSGGEQQRVHFARVLAQLHSDTDAHRYLLLDEPVSSLDVLQQFRLFDRVKTLMQKGMAGLAVVHDLNLACQYADKILAMRNGKVIAYGKTQDVISSELIQNVFGLEASLVAHPLTGKPQVLFGSKEEVEENLMLDQYQPIS